MSAGQLDIVPEFCQELSYGYVAFDVNNVIR
jgi:hypothetical protein